MVVLAVTAGIGLYLGYQAIPTLRHYGLSFFTQTQWLPELDKIGIAAVLVGTAEVALVAMVVRLPLALADLALFVFGLCTRNGQSPGSSPPSTSWRRCPASSTASGDSSSCSPTPSSSPVGSVSTWDGSPSSRSAPDPNAAIWQQSRYTSSVFIAGHRGRFMMTIPLATAVMRAVFDQAPIGEREAAMALGGTRFGVARTVVLPFGRGGIIGGTMLALGRALGETAAVLIIISPEYIIKPRILEAGTQTVSALIAGNFGNATKSQLTALLAAGFVLFIITLAVNSAAAVIIRRSRSGLATEA